MEQVKEYASVLEVMFNCCVSVYNLKTGVFLKRPAKGWTSAKHVIILTNNFYSPKVPLKNYDKNT